MHFKTKNFEKDRENKKKFIQMYERTEIMGNGQKQQMAATSDGREREREEREKNKKKINYVAI